MSQPDLHDQFLRALPSQAPAPATGLAAPPEDLTNQLFSLPRRAGLPRLQPAQRRDLARYIAEDQRGLTLECIAVLQRLAKARYPRTPPVTAEQLQRTLAKEQQVERIAQGAARLGRAATDGALVQNGVLAALNYRVLGYLRTSLRALPPAERDLVQSTWDPVLSLLLRRKADQQAGKKDIERREEELRAQAEAAEKSAAVHRALLSLRAHVARVKKGDPS